MTVNIKFPWNRWANIQKMKQGDKTLDKGWVQIVHILSVFTQGGKQKMNCVIQRDTQDNPAPHSFTFDPPGGRNIAILSGDAIVLISFLSSNLSPSVL